MTSSQYSELYVFRSLLILIEHGRLLNTVSQLTLPVKPHHYLWLGWIFEFLNKKTEAHKAYQDGLAVTTQTTNGVAFELWMARVELYTEEQDWQHCWTTLMAMLNNWPLVPDLYARAAVTVLRKDFQRIPLEAIDAALFWYRAAVDLAPTNSYYKACMTRLENERNRILGGPNPDAPRDPHTFLPISPIAISNGNNFIDMRSQTSLASTGTDYGEVVPPSQRQFNYTLHETPTVSSPPPALPPQRPKVSKLCISCNQQNVAKTCFRYRLLDLLVTPFHLLLLQPLRSLGNSRLRRFNLVQLFHHLVPLLRNIGVMYVFI